VGLRRNKKRRPITRIPASLEPWLDFWDTDDDDIPYILHHGEPIRSVRQTFKRKGKELGFPELTPYTLRHKMATELSARGVGLKELAYQMGHLMPDLKTTQRYMKFDKRYLANAKAAIEEYLVELNSLTKRDLLAPHTPKILPSASNARTQRQLEIPFAINEIRMVGATGIEPVTPTMST
jgi:integrase